MDGHNNWASEASPTREQCTTGRVTIGTVPVRGATGISGMGGVEHWAHASFGWQDHWLNEDNEIEPEGNKKELNKGMLG